MTPAARCFRRRREAGATVIEPLPTSPIHWSERAMRLLLGCLAGASLLAGLGLAVTLLSASRWRAPWELALCPFCPFAALGLICLLAALGPGRRAGYPLVATPEGKLSSGGTDLANRAVSVRVEPASALPQSSRGGNLSCVLYIEAEGGRCVELPRPGYSPLPAPEPAGELAAWLAEALGVAVVHGPVPLAYSRGYNEALWRRRWQVFPMFLIGIPHFLAGVGVAALGPWYFGLIFVASGALLLFLGVRQLGGSPLTWAFLMTALVAAEALVWAAARWRV